jgi:hypothetical protein
MSLGREDGGEIRAAADMQRSLDRNASVNDNKGR